MNYETGTSTMGYYSRNKLNRILSVGALSFPVAVLICLAIVFAGCTSPFSPFNLYFMKVIIGLLDDDEILTRIPRWTSAIFPTWVSLLLVVHMSPR